MPRFSRNAPRGRSLRRKTEWNDGPAGNTGVLSASGQFGFTGGLVDVTAAGITLVRTRGELLIALLAADDVGTAGGFRVAFGLAVVTKQAADAGGASVPDPLSDPDWGGWFYHWEGGLHAVSTTNLDRQVVTAQRRLDIDSKAMRKLGENETIVAQLGIAENGVSTMFGTLSSRLLVKLP